jgi:hypothetical protein
LGQDPQPLATALINDDLVLIASGRGVLEQALDVSQIDELNQAASAPLQKALQRLGEGVALLTARPEAMEQWLGLPVGDESAAVELVLALAPQGSGLQVDGLAQLRDALPSLGPVNTELLRQVQVAADSLAFLTNPAELLAAEDANVWSSLLGPSLTQALKRDQGPLPALVAAADSGPLLWAHQSEGWLLGTRGDRPSAETLQPALEADGYSASPLESRGQTLQAWTRLESKPVKGNPDQLQAQLAGARSSQGGFAWWGQGLAILNQQYEGRRAPQERLDQLELLGAPQAPFQWSMDAQAAQGLLSRWKLWRLVGTLSSSSLTPRVDGVALSLEPDAPDQRSLRLRGLLQLHA